MGVRVVVVDDNPHVRWRGRVYPVNATFHRFLSAFLDLDGAPVSSIVHAVPLRELSDDAPEPATLPLDSRLEVVGTRPFDGIAGYLRSAPSIVRANRPVLRAAIREADLVWIKVPGSNAWLAAALAIAARVPRFVWVAGSARDVAAGRYRGATRLAGIAVGAAYDAIGRLAAVGGARVVVGRRIASGGGVVASLLEPGEIRSPRDSWPRDAAGFRLAWAGRLVEGKGLETLLDAMALLPTTTQLDFLGDGPARGALEARGAALGVGDRVRWHGYVADRAAYLDRLAASDLFVFPSPAEGFPKVVLDAMAVGLPVLASRVGGLDDLAAAGVIEEIPDARADSLAAGVLGLQARPDRASELRRRGLAFAGDHLRSAEAARVVASWPLPAARRGTGRTPDEVRIPGERSGRPSGVLWDLTGRLTSASRQRRLDRFMRELSPTADSTILDVGVTDTAWRSGNFLEAAYPWPARITAVGLGAMPAFQRLYPDVTFVTADGRDLPFGDGSFDIGFSNAVIEHVGDRRDQARFVAEMLRTCRRVFIATPNAAFPIDPHTLLPVVHWLPRAARHRLLRATGNGRWASEAALNPLTPRALRQLFPPTARVRIVRQRVLGLTTVLIAVAEGLTDGAPSARGTTAHTRR